MKAAPKTSKKAQKPKDTKVAEGDRPSVESEDSDTVAEWSETNDVDDAIPTQINKARE